MPTIQQLIRNKKQPIKNRTKSPALKGCPQRRGVCTRVYVRLVSIKNVWLSEITRMQMKFPIFSKSGDGSFRISKWNS